MAERLERYKRGEIDYEELVKATNWSERWDNYQQYRNIVETARELEIPIVALNARAETIRQVARKGGVDQRDAQASEAGIPGTMHTLKALYKTNFCVECVGRPTVKRPRINAVASAL
ncbi:MAG: ChaN family lipoprotein [Planctomycetota bacterium]